jgi:uncharacterized membrane protein YkoI
VTPIRLLIALALPVAIFADTPLKLENAPRAVQDAVKEQTKSATFSRLTREKENGKTTYEIETRINNGKTRVITVDDKGTVLEVEEETDLDNIPPAAKAALQERAAGGTIRKVEVLTQGSLVNYEATIHTKAGRNIEIAVKADGTKAN